MIRKRISNFVALLVMSVGLVLAPVTFTGCASNTDLAAGGVYSGDSVLYNADKTITSSYKVLHSFVKWEHQYRASLPVEVSRAADSIRANAEKWTDSAIALREAYANAPSEENRSKLTSALDVLQAALNEATKYMGQQQTPIQ